MAFIDGCPHIKGAWPLRGVPLYLKLQPVLFLVDDLNTTSIDVTFTPTLTTTCVEIQTLNDSLIEGPELFSVGINTSDRAVEAGEDAIVMIGDRNEGEVMVTLNEPSYEGQEGGVVRVRVEVTSMVSNIQRDVVVTIATTIGTAQG